MKIEELQKINSIDDIYIQEDDNSFDDEQFKIPFSKKIPSERFIPKPDLTTSMCQDQIAKLRDGYQDLNKKVINVQEDGKGYFHQEFTSKVAALNSSKKPDHSE